MRVLFSYASVVATRQTAGAYEWSMGLQLRMHRDAWLGSSSIVDDVIATGGTICEL